VRHHPPRLTDPPNRIVTALLGYAVFSGSLFLAGFSKPASIDESLSPAMRLLWAACLIGGGLAALTGQYWWGRRVFTGARLKRGGLRVAGGGMLAYGAAVLLVNGLSAGGQAGLTALVFGLTFIDRAHQISGLLQEAEAHAASADRGGDGGRGAGG
jgi:hypothetical protein